MKNVLTGILLFTLLASTANAALLSRLSGQAYYDDVLDITWLTDANLADTNDFGVTGIKVDGMMTWAKANEWVGAMNTANHLGTNDWRLPFIVDTGTPGCNFAYTGTDCGFNVQTKSGAMVYSEMAHLYYTTLGNTGVYNTSGTPAGCSIVSPWCLMNTGPFSNLQPHGYWSSTEYAHAPSDAWHFSFDGGFQRSLSGIDLYAWAVRPGDIAAVPVPGAVWLLGGALTLLGSVRRRAMTA